MARPRGSGQDAFPFTRFAREDPDAARALAWRALREHGGHMRRTAAALGAPADKRLEELLEELGISHAPRTVRRELRGRFMPPGPGRGID